MSDLEPEVFEARFQPVLGDADPAVRLAHALKDRFTSTSTPIKVFIIFTSYLLCSCSFFFGN
jgi:hypothetical protein